MWMVSCRGISGTDIYEAKTKKTKKTASRKLDFLPLHGCKSSVLATVLRLSLMHLLLLLACWAPELAPTTAPALPTTPPVTLPEPVALPSPPFDARTRVAPLTLVGPGGIALAQLVEPGIELQVVQVLDERVRVRCTGCPGTAAGVEGWLQRGAVEPLPGTGG